MRIVYVLNNGGLLGANRSLLGTMEYMIKQGNKCYALIPEKSGVEVKFEELGIEYVVIGYRPCVWYPGYIGLPFLVNIVRLPQILKTIKKWNVDLIHSNNSSHDIGMIAALLLRKKHVWHVREIMEYNYRTKYIFPHMYKMLRRKTDATICVSKFIYDYHKDHFFNVNMYMIYNPYDIEYYNIPRKTFAPNDVVRIVMAGGITAYKKQIDSVKAVKELVDRNIRNIKLTIVGDGDAELTKEINEYIDKYHLSEWVEMKEFVLDLRDIRRKADIALCCSEYEALPRVTVEGMLGEMLSIGANSGGIAELITHKERGLLYEVGNSTDLADQIEYAIKHKEECWEMIRRAKEYAIENFELDRSGKRILSVYKEVLEKK